MHPYYVEAEPRWVSLCLVQYFHHCTAVAVIVDSASYKLQLSLMLSKFLVLLEANLGLELCE